MHEEKCSETAPSNIAQFAMRSEKHTRNGVIILSKKQRNGQSENEADNNLTCHMLYFVTYIPNINAKNVKIRGEIEWQWIHSDAGCEPLTEDINYSVVTITLPICKLMLSSNCTRPEDCLTNFSEEGLGGGLDSLDTQILSLSLAVSLHRALFVLHDRHCYPIFPAFLGDKATNISCAS